MMRFLDSIFGFLKPGQSARAFRQSRNATAALGQRESFSTYVGVWFAGAFIAVGLVSAIILVSVFGNERLETAANASSDRTGLNQIGNQPQSQRAALAQQGYGVFKAAGCQNCHLGGGYGVAGQGPRLIYSGNARDSSYVHQIVRQGYSPMPYYPKPEAITQKQTDNGIIALSDADLYKIVVYLQYSQQNSTNKPTWVDPG